MSDQIGLSGKDISCQGLEELEKLQQLLQTINKHKRVAKESASLPVRTAIGPVDRRAQEQSDEPTNLSPPVMHYLRPIQWRETAQNCFGCDRFVPINKQL